MKGTFIAIGRDGFRRLDTIDPEFTDDDEIIIRVSPTRKKQNGEDGALRVAVVRDKFTGKRRTTPYNLRAARD